LAQSPKKIYPHQAKDSLNLKLSILNQTIGGRSMDKKMPETKSVKNPKQTFAKKLSSVMRKKVAPLAGAGIIAAATLTTPASCENGTTPDKTPTANYHTKTIASKNLTLHIEDKTMQLTDTQLGFLDEFEYNEFIYPSDIYIIVVNGNEITDGGNNIYTVGIDNFASLEIASTMVSIIANKYPTAFSDNRQRRGDRHQICLVYGMPDYPIYST
jgi:hypothetical protein